MKPNYLNEIVGVKIRWQYFTVPILMFNFIAIFVPYCILIFSIPMGNFDFNEWMSNAVILILAFFVLSVPFIILSIFNRRYFGKVICVINDDGIYHEYGFVRWNSITKVEYVIKLPQRFNKNNFCHAIIYTRSEKIILDHAPLSILSCVKKYKPELSAKVSSNSKWTIVIMLIIFIIIPFIIPILV